MGTGEENEKLEFPFLLSRMIPSVTYIQSIGGRDISFLFGVLFLYF